MKLIWLIGAIVALTMALFFSSTMPERVVLSCFAGLFIGSFIFLKD